jgi:SAM-dependent methyltransferase
VKQHAGAAERNRGAIADVLSTLLEANAHVLEIGSGTGQHAAYFTRRMPRLQWQASDARPEALASITAYRDDATSHGFLPPLLLDVQSNAWPSGPFDAVFSANVIHIAPWSVCVALVEGAARVLRPNGKLLFYGPFRFDGVLTPESNVAFDMRLRGDDTSWGIRDVADIGSVANAAGFGEPSVHPMPANNHVICFTSDG